MKTLYSTHELVQRWNGAVSAQTLKNWRSLGKGPRYLKIGTRVQYPVEYVIEWEKVNIKGGVIHG